MYLLLPGNTILEYQVLSTLFAFYTWTCTLLVLPYKDHNLYLRIICVVLHIHESSLAGEVGQHLAIVAESKLSETCASILSTQYGTEMRTTPVQYYP
jgi:hypothetical protein